MTQADEKIDRASLVQDRSVRIIKQACRLAAKELRQVVADFKGSKEANAG